jgi:hypothetical protein
VTAGPGGGGYQVDTGTLRQCAAQITGPDCMGLLQKIQKALSGDCAIPPGTFALADLLTTPEASSAYDNVVAVTQAFITALSQRLSDMASRLQATADAYDQADAQSTQAVASIPGH